MMCKLLSSMTALLQMNSLPVNFFLPSCSLFQKSSKNEIDNHLDEALGLCDIGKGGEIVDRGDNTYGGKWVINPSGGLIVRILFLFPFPLFFSSLFFSSLLFSSLLFSSLLFPSLILSFLPTMTKSKGHPLGATGLAQCAELSWQLRGLGGKRQVPNAKVALQHNLGIGGAVVVTMYRMGFPEHAAKSPIRGQPSSSSLPAFQAGSSVSRVSQLEQHLKPVPRHGTIASSTELGDLERLKGKMSGVERKKKGMWMVTGYHAAKAIFDNTTKITSARAIFEAETPEQAERYKDTLDFFASWILVHDPPRHTKYRSLLFQFLTTKFGSFLFMFLFSLPLPLVGQAAN